MLHHNTYIRSFLAILVLMMMVNPVAAAPADAYGGYVSNTDVQQGDEVTFSGTFHNFLDSTLFVVSFNVSFVEQLGEAAQREPNRPNISKYYDTSRRNVIANASLTDSMTENIEFEPGSYNVSIFFQFAEDSQISAVTPLNSSYALVNATFVVEGITQALEIARFIGYVIGVIVIGTIGLLVYNNRFKKSF